MLATKLLATFTQSPIGSIPSDFSRLVDLCRVAWIQFREVVFEAAGEPFVYREWSIVADPDPVNDSHGRQSRGSGNHMKAAMMIKALEWKFPSWDRFQILSELIDHREPFTKDIASLRWQDLHDRLAMAGVPGFQLLQRKRMDIRDAVDAF